MCTVGCFIWRCFLVCMNFSSSKVMVHVQCTCNYICVFQNLVLCVQLIHVLISPISIRSSALFNFLSSNSFIFLSPLQRVHSTRSYKQALEVYKGHGWTLAEDYIHFSLARHSFSLHRLLDAKMAFESLLCHEGSHSPSQQLLYLKDYIFVHRVRGMHRHLLP